MNPVRGYTMLNFLDWLEKHHPHITSLRNLSKKELLNLVGNFGCGQSINNGCLAGKWLAGFDLLFRRIGDFQEYDLAREKLKLIETRSNHLIAEFKELGANFKNNKGYREYDFLARYRNVPLHALFLYTSEDEYVAEYILRNWGALDTLSGENCDIYPSLEQFHNLEDAYDYIEELTVLDGNEILEYSELPGIFFWDNSGNTEYVSLEQDVMPNRIKFIVRTIFGEIKKKASIRSVKRAKERIIQKDFVEINGNHCNLFDFLTSNEIIILNQILIRNINLQTADNRRDILTICGLEKVCALLQLDKPMSQFIISLLAQLARFYIEADSSKRIGLVIFLEFISNIDYSLSEEDKHFIEYILIKLKRSFPQTQDLECLN